MRAQVFGPPTDNGFGFADSNDVRRFLTALRVHAIEAIRERHFGELVFAGGQRAADGLVGLDGFAVEDVIAAAGAELLDDDLALRGRSWEITIGRVGEVEHVTAVAIPDRQDECLVRGSLCSAAIGPVLGLESETRASEPVARVASDGCSDDCRVWDIPRLWRVDRDVLAAGS
ncbi:hypothetical protein DVK01_20265 [Haloarcula sp. Atlit-120R]|nr:hypothetical protein DVK01_20265 [Haloarcula sp. Atlit-120R]